MAIVNDIKTLVSSSKLFMPADVVAKNTVSSSSSSKDKGRGRRKKGLDAKIGQGGTLDPLADGVLGESSGTIAQCTDWLTLSLVVIGVGRGTKKLGDFLDCVKVSALQM